MHVHHVTPKPPPLYFTGRIICGQLTNDLAANTIRVFADIVLTQDTRIFCPIHYRAWKHVIP